MQKIIRIQTPAQGLFEITDRVVDVLRGATIESGLCNIFIQHTSASLTIQENADPTARRDLEKWLNRLVPENDSLFTHTLEGADDMPSHIKSVLTATSLNIPIVNGELGLGTWQGIYLWEHRRSSHKRSVVVTIMKL
ncbi:MAG: secondary thiamine-phosphate synthase enzyme YjbQ [Proteobacteria bacterium]|nr:secondary thiamine-phosphate synthase enzyme YjbQ [Pseudomonadota bacterium]